MRKTLRTTVAVGLAVLASGTATHFTAASFPSDDRTIVHVLNRAGFGPRAGDVAAVRAIGLQRYIEQQLQPDQIADAGVAGRLSGLTTIGMSSREIAERFEIPQLRMRQERKLQAARSGSENQPAPPPRATPEMQQRANQVVQDLAQQKLIRAIYSERQLQEVLTDFWFNHFNVDARKGRVRFMLTEYERDAIRPHVLGRFSDLLEATARSPAMLFYLDNWQSAAPNSPDIDAAAARRRQALGRRPGRGRALGQPLPAAPAQQPVNRPRRGLNENYGRELMELHTLGVDGGYTQQDVTEVARAFTGWTIENPRQGAGYRFDPRLHDDGEKVVLGHRIKAGGGERDGIEVLDLLSRHPSTARFIATKLVRRFVSDTPPPALVERAAGRFRQTDGDLREVMRTILTSPEFLSVEAYRAKVKTPFEFMVSTIRATGAEVQDGLPLVRAMQQLGMPLYACQPPTGYRDTADVWMNTGALVSRMNIALSVAANQMRGVSIASQSLPTDSRGVAEVILNGDVSEATLATIAKATTAPQMLALAVGAPEFQRR
ncbi:MAG: DUF1800 domain-containing protein [Acidobacteriota bacterium]